MSEIFLQHPKGSSASILLFGATVTSWKSATRRDPKPTERLFLSSKALLDGSKPVRGGIPVVFPCFGPPTHPDHIRLPQHGFARSEIWSWDGQIIHDEQTVSATLTLKVNPRISQVFSKPFELRYMVALEEFRLSTELRVLNTATSDNSPDSVLHFHALFHNYILAPSNEAIVSPLQGIVYYDKTESTEEARTSPKTETRNGVDVRNFTDSVYEDTPDTCKIVWGGGGISVEKEGLKDLVIWNPQAEHGRKMGDMENGGWERYICVEPGHVRNFCSLDAGQHWTGKQTLSVIHEQNLAPL